MPLYNLEHTVKIDEVGKEIGFTCYDSTGAAVNLTNYTMTMNVRKGSTLVIDDAAVTKRTQSGATLGQCYHTWTALTIPNDTGAYKGELKAVFGSNVLFFPVNKNNLRTYFKITVQSALA